MTALQTTSPSSCYLLTGWGFAVTRPQAAKRPHQIHKPPLTSLLSWGVPLPSPPWVATLSCHAFWPGSCYNGLLSPTRNPVRASPNKAYCVLLPLVVISFSLISLPKPSHPYRTATSWEERASVDPATHTYQEQWPFTTGHGSGDGPKTPLLRGTRGKEQCRLVQWELEVHSRKLPPGPGTYFCAWSEAKV